VTKYAFVPPDLVLVHTEDITERVRAEEEASYERDLLQTLLDRIPDYVYFKDRDRRFVRASNSFTDLFKRDLEDILGKVDEELFPPEIAEETANDDRRVIEAGTPLINKEEGGESIGGEEHWVLTTKLPWYDEQGNIIGLFGLSREITERKQAQRALQKRTHELAQRVTELSALNRIAQVVATSADMRQTLGAAAETVAGLFDARSTFFTVPDYEDAELQVMAGFERTSGTFGATSLAFSLDETPYTRQVLEQGQPLVLSNLQTLPLAPSVQAFVSERDLQTMLFVPLRARGMVIGTLAVGSDQTGRTFTPDEIALAETIASDVAVALENVWLAEQAQAAAVDAERQRLARELHDSVTQSLYSVTLLANGWGTMAAQGRLEDPAASFRQISNVGQQALREMRLLIHQLRPPILEEVGLVGALQQRLEAVEQRAGIEGRLFIEGDTEDLPDEVEEQFFYIAQEALNNTLRHANAPNVVVRIGARPDQVTLSVEDNGQGFDTGRASAGMGLTTMQERAEAIGAQLSIASAPEDGTTVQVAVALGADEGV
jgi:PAS domain S-box-containing protein